MTYKAYHNYQENQTAQTNSRKWSLPSLLNNHLYEEYEDEYTDIWNKEM